MVQKSELQRTLDHVGLGRIEAFKNNGDFYAISTNQGKFIVHQASPYNVLEIETQIEAEIRKKYGDVSRVLMPDYTGKLNNDASYVHQKGKYYSIYKIIEA